MKTNPDLATVTKQLAEAQELIRQLRDAGHHLNAELINARYRLKTLGYVRDLPGEQAMKRWGKLTQ